MNYVHPRRFSTRRTGWACPFISAPHHSDHAILNSFKAVKLVVSWIQCHHLPSLRLDCSGTIALAVQMPPLSPPWPSAIHRRVDLGCLLCILPGESGTANPVGSRGSLRRRITRRLILSRDPVPLPSGLAVPCTSHFRLWLDCSAASLAKVRRSIKYTMGRLYV